MITHEATLSIGRLLNGIGAAIMNVVFGKMITETMPEHLVSTFAMAHNSSICGGFIIVYGLGAFLPDAKDMEANRDDELWRVIWFFPAFIGVIVILCTLIVFKHEPVAFCLMEGRDDEAKQHLKRIYRKKNPNSQESIEQHLDAHYGLLRKCTTLDASSTTFK